MRGKDGNVIHARNGMGTLHVLRKGKLPRGTKISAAKPEPRLTIAEVKATLKRCRGDLNLRLLNEAAESLAVSVSSLELFGIGYDRLTDSYSFPMFGGDRKPCGIRLRSRRPDGDGQHRKGSVKGSRNGLFIPTDYDPKPVPFAADDAPYMLLLPEGPTSAAAARDLGLMAIGRPSNKGGVMEVVNVVRMTCPQDICVVADRDGYRRLPNGHVFFPGFEGALQLVEQLLPLANCHRLRLIQTPKGTKDLRAWIRDGGTAGLLRKMLCESEIITPQWIGEQRQQVETWRKRLYKPAAADPQKAA